MMENPASSPTRTEETVREYLRRAGLLITRFERETGESWADDPMAFCRWAGDLRPELAPASWRQYKASLVCFMEQNGPVEAVRYLRELDTAPCRRKTRRTSAQKARRLPIADLEAIIEEVQRRYEFRRENPQGVDHDRDTGSLLVLWLLAGRLMGLRPSEWRHARIEGDFLVVQNAKNTNGRANGDWRRVPLPESGTSERRWVEALVGILGGNPDFERLRAAVTRMLHRITRKLWPGRGGRRKNHRYPTLYSARHQYSANIKAAGLSREAVAALMGHASIETAAIHYGRKAWGDMRRMSERLDLGDRIG